MTKDIISLGLDSRNDIIQESSTVITTTDIIAIANIIADAIIIDDVGVVNDMLYIA